MAMLSGVKTPVAPTNRESQTVEFVANPKKFYVSVTCVPSHVSKYVMAGSDVAHRWRAPVEAWLKAVLFHLLSQRLCVHRVVREDCSQGSAQVVVRRECASA